MHGWTRSFNANTKYACERVAGHKWRRQWHVERGFEMDRDEAGKDTDRAHGDAPAEGADPEAQGSDTEEGDVRRHSQQAAEGDDDNGVDAGH